MLTHSARGSTDRTSLAGANRALPTKIKLLRGNPGRRPLNENEPEPEVHWPAIGRPCRHFMEATSPQATRFS